MFDPDQAILIANPESGGGFIRHRWDALGKQIRSILGPIAMRQTESAGHGSEIAREAVIDGATTIISFGGDGTHSEVTDGIMQSGRASEVSLGILHAGTGGDFRKMINGADDVVRGCQVIRDSERTLVDVGWVEYEQDAGGRQSRYFLNITSMGMGGLVDRYVAASKSKRGGTTKYLMASLRAHFEYKPAVVRVTIDGRECGEHEVGVVCVCNGRWAGGGMMFAPEAKLSDGEFDIVVLRAASTLRGLPIMAGLYKGTHVRSSFVDAFRGKHVIVEVLSNTAYMDIDGEAPGIGPAEFRLEPRALGLLGLSAEFV